MFPIHIECVNSILILKAVLFLLACFFLCCLCFACLLLFCFCKLAFNSPYPQYCCFSCFFCLPCDLLLFSTVMTLNCLSVFLRSTAGRSFFLYMLSIYDRTEIIKTTFTNQTVRSSISSSQSSYWSTTPGVRVRMMTRMGIPSFTVN